MGSFGASDPARLWNGQLDEVRISTVARSPERDLRDDDAGPAEAAVATLGTGLPGATTHTAEMTAPADGTPRVYISDCREPVKDFGRAAQREQGRRVIARVLAASASRRAVRGRCSPLSRAQQLATGFCLLAIFTLPSTAEAITRCEVLARAQTWVDARVPYSQSSWYANHCGSYRQDCSGYVSMAWALPASMVTSTLPQVSSRLGSFNDLRPGDAVNRTCCHVYLFKEWKVPGVSFWAYEERGSGQVAGVFEHTVSAAASGGYAPYRLNGIEECCERHCEGDTIVDESCGRGDCSQFGSRCVHDALGARCVFAYCPAIGQRKVCLDERKIADCNDGQLSAPGDCGAFGAYCSTAGADDARCVSAFCVASPQDAPVAHDACLPDGRLVRCTAEGALEDPRDCAAGERCVVEHGSARCAASTPSAEPEAAPAADPAADPAEPPSALPGAGTGLDAGLERSSAAGKHLVGVGCAVTASPRRGSATWVLLLVAATLARRRRRRRIRASA